MSENVLTANELAAEMEISPKALRRFMRSISDVRAGSGNRYQIKREDAERIKSLYSVRQHKQITFVISDEKVKHDPAE